jgi:IS5 family transposase
MRKSRYTDSQTISILCFRHLLERLNLAQTALAMINALLIERGLLLNKGSIVDTTLFAVPPSTKNREKKRDPEMG